MSYIIPLKSWALFFFLSFPSYLISNVHTLDRTQILYFFAIFKYKVHITYPLYISSSNIHYMRHVFDYAFHLFFEPVNPPNILRWIFRNVTGCDSVATTTVGATSMNTGLILTNWMGRDPRSQLCLWSRCVRPCSIPLIKWMPDHYALPLKDGLISKRNLVSKRLDDPIFRQATKGSSTATVKRSFERSFKFHIHPP